MGLRVTVLGIGPDRDTNPASLAHRIIKSKLSVRPFFQSLTPPRLTLSVFTACAASRRSSPCSTGKSWRPSHLLRSSHRRRRNRRGTKPSPPPTDISRRPRLGNPDRRYRELLQKTMIHLGSALRGKESFWGVYAVCFTPPPY